MTGIFIGLILFIISDNLLLGNISSIEQKFAYALISSRQDTTYEDTISIIQETNIGDFDAISPGKALMYSLAFPGLGQAYISNWEMNKRVFFFATIEALSIWTWYNNDRLGKQYELKYKFYADEYWSFSRWLHDYYVWDTEDNPKREIFINTITNSYTDIWDDGHSINFTCEANDCQKTYYRTSDDQFAELYETFCGGTNDEGTCNNSELEIDQKLIEYGIIIERDHHYYENIGKYDVFFAGWSDNDLLEGEEKSSGELLAMSPNKRSYRIIYEEADEKYFKVATYALSVIVANHAVSMLDALISIKVLKMRNKMALSAHPYYDPKTKWGIGGVKISLKL